MKGPSFLPPFNLYNNDDGEVISSEGSLFIGLTELVPGRTLSLLFQVAEATANPAQEITDMKWWYLADNEWIELKKDVDVIEDETRDLTTSGLIQFSLPQQISNRNTTILPADKHWLRVTLGKGVAGVANTVAIHSQAVRAEANLSSRK